MKKIIIILVVLLVAIGIGIAGYFVFNKKEKVLSSSINAIPTDASLIFEINNLNDFSTNINNKSVYWNELTQLKIFKDIKTELVTLDSVFNKDDNLRNNYLKKSLLISAHKSGKKDIDFLFVVQNKLNVNADLIKSTFFLKEGDLSISEYDKNKIYTLKTGKKYSFSILSGVIIISKSKLLIEKAIRQINANVSVLDNPIYKRIALTAGANVDANLYLNVNSISELLKPVFSKSILAKIDANSAFTDQTELDFYIKENEILLNGFSYLSDSLNNYMNIFKGQAPVSFDIEEILPANTSMFLLYGISDKEKYEKSYNKYLEYNKALEKHNKKLNEIKTKYNYNLQKEFYSFLDDEIVVFYTDINKLDYNQNAFVAIKTLSKSMAKDKLNILLDAYAGLKGVETTSLETEYKIDDETSQTIYSLPINIPSTIFGDVFANITGEYFTYIDNYLVFGNSVKSLSSVIYDNVLQKTLDNSIQYNKIKDRVSSSANFNLYVDIPAFTDYAATYFNEDYIKKIEENKELIGKFKSLIYQSEIENDLLYNTVYINYNPISKDKPRTVWESKMDTALAFKPKVVLNHKNNKNEIFVQDLKNNIYLINDAGRILWKKNIGERILGEIYQVDFYKNKKLQYLFNTKNKIHLIDRNGNYVERYPININNGASCGLALFDYDKNRDYRILIPDLKKKAKLYNIEGNILEGWEFDESDNIVHTTPQHFRIDTKDYIVFADSLKTYILDRKGKTRVAVSDYYNKSWNNNFVLDKKTELHKDRLITTDSKGQIKFIYFDGTVKTFKFNDFSEEHFFLFRDIDGDYRRDYIFADKTKLIAYNYKKEVILEYNFNSNISEKPSYYQFPENVKKLGVVLKSEDEIYLINSDATLYQGFPLKGQTGFSIARFEGLKAEFNLIVGADNEFLFNYKVK
jgi:hypothetical protein